MTLDPATIRALANDWLRDLCLALRNVALYSEQHVRGREYLDRAYESLRRAMGDRREVILARGEGRLYLDQLLLDRERGLIQQLCQDLGERGVEALVIHDTLTPEEHLGFVRTLLMPSDRISEKGGFAPALLDAGVSSIKVSHESWTPGRREPADSSLIGQLLQQQSIGGRTETASALLRQDPAAVAQTLEEQAGRRDPGGVPPGDAVAEGIADTLERVAERALEEHQWDREEVLDYVGRALVACSPALHHTLFLEKAGSRSVRKHIVAAAEGLRPDAIAEMVMRHRDNGPADYRRLGEILARTAVWRDHREPALEAVERRLEDAKVAPGEIRDLIDHLTWGEVALGRRLELLSREDQLWRADFSRIREVLVKLLASEQVKEAASFIRKYLGGLNSPELEIRRIVADNSRYLLQMLEKTPRGTGILTQITELFFSRLQDERDADVVSRLAGGLAFLTDMRLRSNELSSALELLRRAEQLASSPAPAIRDKGEKLAEALGRVGNDRIFKGLTARLLEGEDASSQEAAEILKRSGSRSANFLIERLAEEENRSHRARLVMLLKEMGKGSSAPFLSCLDDTRWFLVRNVIGILGDIGDPSALPGILKVAGHGDPRVRREVVRTLARLPSQESEERILAALTDEDRGVQITSINALASLKGARGVGALLDLARKAPPFTEISPEVRCEVLVTLGRMGAKQVFPLLSELLTRRGLLGPSESNEIRVAAVKGLSALGTAEALELVSRTATKESRQAVREAARDALQARTATSTNAPGGKA